MMPIVFGNGGMGKLSKVGLNNVTMMVFNSPILLMWEGAQDEVFNTRLFKKVRDSHILPSNHCESV